MKVNTSHAINILHYYKKTGIYSGNLFVHSDDNLEVIKFKEYIKQNNLQFVVYSITDEHDNGGTVVIQRYKRSMKTIDGRNKKTVDEMNADEIRSHVIKMLAAIEIMKKSTLVITDYQSNVAQFMKLYYTTNVLSAQGHEPRNYSTPAKNPAYEFSY